MGLRDRLRRLEREVAGDGIVLRLQDGTVRVFEEMEILKEMFLTQYHLFRGASRESEVLDAVRNATPESKQAFEERFGPITMGAQIVAAEYQGGWVKVYTLAEDGTVEKTFHEGGSEEAERIRREACAGAAQG
jgi:Zn/Cd-binding protein ZinT